MAGSSNNSKRSTNLNIAAAILVAALGYFVDIFDLVLFGVVQNESLKDLGYEGEAAVKPRTILFNLQMGGMLIGGILWGVLGDKKGRLKVLFGSILIYSLANIANGLVNDIYMYGLCRFIAGIGLAGELGAGITLVSELMPKNKRGLGTTIVAAIGLMGAVTGGWLKESGYDWRTLYYIGGGLGLTLLVLRIGVTESGIFAEAEASEHKKGDFLALFRKKERFVKFLSIIVIGFPVWYVIGVIVYKCDLIAQHMNMTDGIPTPARAIPFAYVGLVIGDIMSGLISQKLKSRKKILYLFLGLCATLTTAFFFVEGISTQTFYILCFFLGFSVGYWVIFVTIASEQFGTNIRATVTTSAPNFVRGGEVIMSLSFLALYNNTGNYLYAAAIVGVVVISASIIAVRGIKESFHEDLNYMETM